MRRRASHHTRRRAWTCRRRLLHRLRHRRRLGEHQRLFAELRAKLRNQGGVGALAQHPLELRAIVVGRADAVHDDIADEPPASALRHPVHHDDLAAIPALDDRRHPRLVVHTGFALPRHQDAVDRVDGSGETGDETALEQFGEESGELVPLGGGPHVPLVFQGGGGGAAHVRDVGDETLDPGNPFQWPRAGGRIVQDGVHGAEELAHALGRRAGVDRRRGREKQADQTGGSEQETGTRRETHIYNIGCRAPLMI